MAQPTSDLDRFLPAGTPEGPDATSAAAPTAPREGRSSWWLRARRLASSSTFGLTVAVFVVLLATRATVAPVSLGDPSPTSPDAVQEPEDALPYQPSASSLPSRVRSAPTHDQTRPGASEARRGVRPGHRDARALSFSFASAGSGGSAAPPTGSPAGPARDTAPAEPEPEPVTRSRQTTVKPKPSPSPEPTPEPKHATYILYGLIRPGDGAYAFTTDPTRKTDLQTKGYSRVFRVALVWGRGEGASKQLWLDDAYPTYVHSSEDTAPAGSLQLWATSTRRWGVFYSLDREVVERYGPPVRFGYAEMPR